jgi:hypothetical protein
MAAASVKNKKKRFLVSTSGDCRNLRQAHQDVRHPNEQQQRDVRRRHRRRGLQVSPATRSLGGHQPQRQQPGVNVVPFFLLDTPINIRVLILNKFFRA